MKEIKCSSCGHKETVNDSFAKNTKVGETKCTSKKGCSGKMIEVGE